MALPISLPLTENFTAEYLSLASLKIRHGPVLVEMVAISFTGTFEPLSVGTIANDFNISRNGISKHIIVLRESGLVNTEYSGRENYVSLNAQQLAEVYQWVSLFEEFWKTKLNKLKKLVESKHKTR